MTLPDGGHTAIPDIRIVLCDVDVDVCMHSPVRLYAERIWRPSVMRVIIMNVFVRKYVCIYNIIIINVI